MLSLLKHSPSDCESKTSVSRLEVSNAPMLMQQIAAIRASAALAGHRALILLETPPGKALNGFAATHKIPFIDARHSSDRADRITEVLGCEFDILIHETDERIDAGLLAALAGTVKAGGILVLGLPFSPASNDTVLDTSPFNQRFARLLSDLLLRFADTVLWLQPASSSGALAQTLAKATRPREEALPPRNNSRQIEAARSVIHPEGAVDEQNELLGRACDYLKCHSRGCITITGRRGRGKSALLGKMASWLDQQGISYAVTAARQSALTSLHRHSAAQSRFIAAADAHRSGRQVLLVDEASSLPIDLLQRYLESHDYVIYGATVEGYENAGRAFDIRFQQILTLHYPHALRLEPKTPWRWHAGDPLEHLIDTLLLSEAHEITTVPQKSTSYMDAPGQKNADLNAIEPSLGWSIRSLDRTALAMNEPLLRQVYSLLRDTHYQTTAADLAHLLDAPDLQLWVLQEGELIKAALLLVMEGGIDTSLHEAIVSKRRRLPHQLLPQLLAQSANQAQALAETYCRIIRIAVTERDRRHGHGSKLLQAVELAIMIPQGPVGGIGASFASDEISLEFWKKNGFIRFHTGFKPNPRTGKQAVAVLKTCTQTLAAVTQQATAIHEDNQRWLKNHPTRSEVQHRDTELLHRLVHGQRSVHDTYAALCRLAQTHQIPLVQESGTSRRQFEADLRSAVNDILLVK